MILVYNYMILKLKCKHLVSVLFLVNPHDMLQATSTLGTELPGRLGLVSVP